MQPIDDLQRWVPFGIVTLLIVACTAPPPPPARDAPEPRQFTATKVRIEEQRNGRVVWSGTAVYAEGDFSNAMVRDVDLVRHPDAGQPALTFRAPRGTLTFEDGTAEFEDVSILHTDGAVLRAVRAQYDEASQTVAIEGPLDLRSATLWVRGTRASIDLESDIIDVAGPIEGRWTPVPAQSP